MVFEGVVHNGSVMLPPEAHLPEGTIVRIETPPVKRFGDLMELAGAWEGDDADRVVAEIYSLRTSAPRRAPLES